MKAWELLSQPGAWTQNEFASDIDGDVCDSESEFACRWCTLGAINRVYKGAPGWHAAIHKLESQLGCLITVWNDTYGRKQEEVVAVLKELDI
jgi:hypothetical protein